MGLLQGDRKFPPLALQSPAAAATLSVNGFSLKPSLPAWIVRLEPSEVHPTRVLNPSQACLASTSFMTEIPALTRAEFPGPNSVLAITKLA